MTRSAHAGATPMPRTYRSLSEADQKPGQTDGRVSRYDKYHSRKAIPPGSGKGSSRPGRDQETTGSNSPMPDDNRRVLLVVIVVASIILAGLLTFRIWGELEDGNGDAGELEYLETFQGGATEVLVNTTYLGTDTHIKLPWDANVQLATISVSGSLPPQRTTYQAGRNPTDIAVGDINGDLFTDALVANNGDGTIMLMRHDGTNFVQQQVLPCGEGPIKVILENFDDHPLPDAAVISEDSRELWVFINDRAGGLRKVADPFTFNTLPADMTTLDHDGDGDLDIAVITTNDDNLTIFHNDGLGNFALAMNQTLQGNPTRIASGDMDNDGKTDLVISNRRDVISFTGEPHKFYDSKKDKTLNWLSTVSIWYRDETGGGFRRSFDDLRSEKGVSSIELGDLNGDGYLDAAMANLGYHNVSLIMSDGNGGFYQGPLADFDHISLGSMDPIQAKVIDLDKDMDLDIVALSKSSDSVLIYRNDGTGSFIDPDQFYVGLNPTSFELMDFDSDGDKDVVTSDWKGWIERNGDNGSVSVLINLRDGIFGTYKQYRTGNSPRGVFTKDVDRDGDPEIASANYFGSTISILRNDGLGRFSSPREYPIGLEPYAVVMEDFDGDGNIDGASADEANFRIVLLESDGDGGFTNDRFLYDIGAYPFSLRTGDIDSDGDMDLYTSNYFQGSTTLMFNDGSGNFETMFSDYRTIPLGDDLPYDSIIEDVNGDGQMDLITVNRGDTLDPTSTISVMLNDGTFSYDEKVTYDVGKEPTSAVMFDFDSDGDIDIATANTGDDSVSVLLNNGMGVFIKMEDFPAGDRPQYINVIDMDEDGWMDILATNTDTNNLIFLRNKGGTDFEFIVDLNIGSYPFAIDTADFNGDGRMDITISVVNTNFILVTGCYWYPQDVSIDIGADGTIDHTVSGLLMDDDINELDITDQVREYLKGKDVDGDVRVPIKVIAGEEGVVILSDLLVIYR